LIVFVQFRVLPPKPQTPRQISDYLSFLKSK